ncbi:MAG: hypothetical protein LOY03_12650 [Cyclobacteriaceae bacterium]|jgi:hypothetical protein|nr:hypothetical protein [Cyclobacteriaceae bacterium]
MSLLILIIIAFLPQSQELEPGFYLTQEKSPNCQNMVRLSTKKKDFLCLAPRPIIPTSEFRAITDIKEDLDAGVYYADLSLSDEGVRVLKALAASFRGSTMVLILNNRLAGVLNYNESPFVRENQIRVSVPMQQGTLVEVHTLIKAIIAENLKRTAGSEG